LLKTPPLQHGAAPLSGAGGSAICLSPSQITAKMKPPSTVSRATTSLPKALRFFYCFLGSTVPLRAAIRCEVSPKITEGSSAQMKMRPVTYRTAAGSAAFNRLNRFIVLTRVAIVPCRYCNFPAKAEGAQTPHSRPARRRRHFAGRRFASRLAGLPTARPGPMPPGGR
jgi:hypothetical protein